MSPLFFSSLTTGILSALIVWLSSLLDIESWVVFLGATSYFASQNKGLKALSYVWLTNASGALWAIAIIMLSGVFSEGIGAYLTTGIIAFMMCIQAKLPIFKFIPGTFIGAAAIFATHNVWPVAFISLFFGSIFGFMMLHGGDLLHKYANRNKAPVSA